MNKSFVLCSIILLMGISHVFAEDTVPDGRALNFPTKKYGISIGNSHEFTGIRMNFADEDVKRINGLNFTLWIKPRKNQDAVINGMSIGVVPSGDTLQYINLGLLGVGVSHGYLNGISIGGLLIGSGGDINGLSIGGLFVMTDEGDPVRINGITIGGLAVGTDGYVNGVTSSLACLVAREIRGLSATIGYLGSNRNKGVTIAGYAKTDQMQGLSIALVNKTAELHGVQFGLLNYAENNPKWLRLLPFINFHL